MSRYNSVKQIKDKGITRVGTATLPEYEDVNSDILLIATDGDRCDQLATIYYGDPKLWWFIATVNNLSSNNIPIGTQLRVPTAPTQAILE